MNESMTSELRALRARAYGPDADLHDDPIALDRLRELEEIARAGAGDPAPPDLPDAPDAAPDAPGAADAAPERDEPAEAEVSADSVDAASDPPEKVKGWPLRKWSSTRAAVVLIACVATAVVVTAAATSAILRRVQADSQEVAVLAIDPVATVPEAFRGWRCDEDGACVPDDEAQGTVFREFYGLSAFTTSYAYTDADGASACLMVIETSMMSTEGNAFNGPAYSGCAAGEFPAMIQLLVTADLPEELREEFPEGSGLQFVLEGDEVVVLSDTR